MSNEQHLIAIVGGRSFTVRLSDNTDRSTCLDFVTGRLGPGHGNAPDAFLLDEWLETVEGFRIRRGAVEAWTRGHKEGEWAVSDRS